MAAKRKIKQPYFFQMKDEAPFAFAGIWDSWQGRRPLHNFVRESSPPQPNELLATIHDRMPVILATTKARTDGCAAMPERQS
jgi:putative SOS response-associated peptidase YedK